MRGWLLLSVYEEVREDGHRPVLRQDCEVRKLLLGLSRPGVVQVRESRLSEQLGGKDMQE